MLPLLAGGQHQGHISYTNAPAATVPTALVVMTPSIAMLVWLHVAVAIACCDQLDVADCHSFLYHYCLLHC